MEEASTLQTDSSFVRRAFGSLAKPRGAAMVLVPSALLALALAWADLVVNSRIDRNAVVAGVLQLEIKRERSKDGWAARQMHADLIRAAITSMDDRATRLVGWIDPKYSPLVQLAPALDALTNTSARCSHDQALENAQVVLARTAKLWEREKDFKSVSAWSSYAATRTHSTAQFLANLRRQIQTIDSKRDFQSAERGCLESRFAVLMVTSTWVDYSPVQRRTVSTQLTNDLQRLRRVMGEIADDPQNNLTSQQRELIRNYAANVGGRQALVAALQNGGFPSGRTRIYTDLAAKH